jgi:hypothetical protein
MGSLGVRADLSHQTAEVLRRRRKEEHAPPWCSNDRSHRMLSDEALTARRVPFAARVG